MQHEPLTLLSLGRNFTAFTAKLSIVMAFWLTVKHFLAKNSKYCSAAPTSRGIC
jgi:hypothetical protein